MKKIWVIENSEEGILYLTTANKRGQRKPERCCWDNRWTSNFDKALQFEEFIYASMAKKFLFSMYPDKICKHIKIRKHITTEV